MVTWPALSSTSPDMDETKRFLSKGGEGKEDDGDAVHNRGRVGLQHPAVLAVPG